MTAVIRGHGDMGLHRSLVLQVAPDPDRRVPVLPLVTQAASTADKVGEDCLTAAQGSGTSGGVAVDALQTLGKPAPTFQRNIHPFGNNNAVTALPIIIRINWADGPFISSNLYRSSSNRNSSTRNVFLFL